MTTTEQTLPTDEMVAAYLTAQRAYVEGIDRGIRYPNAGGLHSDTVRDACRAGLAAALATQAQSPERSACDGDPTNCERNEGYGCDCSEAATQEPTPPDTLSNFQAEVQKWMMVCFGEEISNDTNERNHRFLEESLELVQACGCTRSEAHQLVDYVYGRPVGEKFQEAGGVMVTLAALCLAQDMSMHAAGFTELARIWTKVDQIRAKQATKPKHSPLPATHPALTDERGAIAALRELVACKDIKDRAEALHFAGPLSDLGEGWKDEYDRLRADYIKRQPLAWDTARALLAAASPTTTDGDVSEARNMRVNGYLAQFPGYAPTDRQNYEVGFDAGWHEHSIRHPLSANLSQEVAKARRHGFLDALSQGTHHRMWGLLQRAMKQLDAWQKQYGEHSPDWLPPAGDVRLMEDFAAFTSAQPATTNAATEAVYGAIADAAKRAANLADEAPRGNMADAYKWGYEYLQSRMESIGRHGWAHDCDGEIEARIAPARIDAPTPTEDALERLVEEQEGWKLVPVEPTPEMSEAADLAMMTPRTPHGGTIRGGIGHIWRAMVAAAPTGEPK